MVPTCSGPLLSYAHASDAHSVRERRTLTTLVRVRERRTLNPLLYAHASTRTLTTRPAAPRLIMRFATILLATASLVDGFAPAGLGGARRRSALAATATGNPVIKAASAGMGLLKPIFSAEASLQAAALGGLAGVDEAEVVAEIEAAKKANPVLIYTYALSPFSTEALALLDSTGYVEVAAATPACSCSYPYPAPTPTVPLLLSAHSPASLLSGTSTRP